MLLFLIQTVGAAVVLCELLGPDEDISYAVEDRGAFAVGDIECFGPVLKVTKTT